MAHNGHMSDAATSSFAFARQLEVAPARWKESCANRECTLHQLAPYIGKIKSTIAADLVKNYSSPSNLVVDPFAGAGTIPFEATISGRRTFAADISPYARVLSLAKLCPPRSEKAALKAAEDALDEASQLPDPDLRSVPKQIRVFFHPDTLREALKFAEIGRQPGNEFVMACFLGILHHQRPGFLSYPSSHLVPYLRDRKYPRSEFPDMYEYRELRPRLLAKVKRSYKRLALPKGPRTFVQSAVSDLDFPSRFDALITSPPYMNALDYGRDNRLRLWFIDPEWTDQVDNDVTQRIKAFTMAIKSLSAKVETGLRRGGFCVLVVGEELQRSFKAHPSEVVFTIFRDTAPSLRLCKVVSDDIPDVRRTRRECHGIKSEHFLIFKKN